MDDLIGKTFTLKYFNSDELFNILNDLIGGNAIEIKTDYGYKYYAIVCMPSSEITQIGGEIKRRPKEKWLLLTLSGVTISLAAFVQRLDKHDIKITIYSEIKDCFRKGV